MRAHPQTQGGDLYRGARRLGGRLRRQAGAQCLLHLPADEGAQAVVVGLRPVRLHGIRMAVRIPLAAGRTSVRQRAVEPRHRHMHLYVKGGGRGPPRRPGGAKTTCARAAPLRTCCCCCAHVCTCIRSVSTAFLAAMCATRPQRVSARQAHAPKVSTRKVGSAKPLRASWSRAASGPKEL